MSLNERLSFLKGLLSMYEGELSIVEASKRDPRFLVNKERIKRVRLLLKEEMLKLEKEL